ncbi:MAG TPA: flagellum biosynthesis protein FlbT [Rhodospirillales bacterium]|nr:flagellum biosynthesis protein FlbT [Rhodospirillales bacterium]
MPLKIHLRKDQKIIINGAVLENTNAHNISLLVRNSALIMRDDDILTPEEAVTPAARAYYTLQCLYLFPEDEEANLPRFNEYLDNYVKAAPSSRELVDDLKRLVEEGKFYQALKKCRELIAHEQKVLEHVQKRVGEKLCDATAGGKSEGS